MSELDGIFDYLLDVARGNIPGPIGMLKAPDEKGPLGEYLIKYGLDNNLATTGYPTYTNLIVPGTDASANIAEIDVLLLTAKGIFVFEFKNYAGWIFGSANQRQWTVSLAKDKRERFYSPVLQNRTHIRALADYLGLDTSAFRSYIVFSARCVLKAVPDDTAEYCICQRPGLRARIKRDLRERLAIFDNDTLRSIKERLDLLAAASSEDAREEHVEQVQAALRTCPVCGNPLVERHRKSDGGTFIGCSGYPKCRYTRNSW